VTAIRPHDSSTQIGQLLLRLQYQALARSRTALPSFLDVEFKCYSQNGEDGILLYLFSLLGTTNRRVVEVCAGHGMECNAANLIVNHGFEGLLLDGDESLLTLGRDFYASYPTTFIWPPVLAQAWITTENINEVVSRHGFVGTVDLLSLDLDGNDYWIWQALECIAPRVVVLEFNAGIGPDRSLTMTYQDDFRLDLSAPPYRCGASLAAFVKLGRAKGYRLVGVQSMCFNAFFVRDGIGEDVLLERTPAECFAQTPRLHHWSLATQAQLLSGPQWWDEV
jgi:hypothetical protein